MKKTLIAIIILILGTIMLIQFIPNSQKVIHDVISSKEHYMCEYRNDEWSKKDEFIIGEEVWICFSISSIEKTETYPVNYRVYKQEISGDRIEVLNGSIRVSKDGGRINLPLDFEIGTYLVKVICYRTDLFELTFSIIN